MTGFRYYHFIEINASAEEKSYLSGHQSNLKRLWQ
jgi:hypothetical protein